MQTRYCLQNYTVSSNQMVLAILFFCCVSAAQCNPQNRVITSCMQSHMTYRSTVSHYSLLIPHTEKAACYCTKQAENLGPCKHTYFKLPRELKDLKYFEYSVSITVSVKHVQLFTVCEAQCVARVSRTERMKKSFAVGLSFNFIISSLETDFHNNFMHLPCQE